MWMINDIVSSPPNKFVGITPFLVVEDANFSRPENIWNIYRPTLRMINEYETMGL